jgi:hypothetical protein
VRNQSADLKVAPLPGYVSNHVPRAGTGISADFRGCPRLALRRVGNIETVLDEGAKVVQEIENWLLSKRAKLFGRKSVAKRYQKEFDITKNRGEFSRHGQLLL